MANYYEVKNELCRLGKTEEEARDALSGALFDYIEECIGERVAERLRDRLATEIAVSIDGLGEYGVGGAGNCVVYFPDETAERYARDWVREVEEIGVYAFDYWARFG